MKFLWLDCKCGTLNIVGAFQNDDGWKYTWVAHDGVLHMWGPFAPNWNKL